MYCAIVVPYRVRIVIPASEMWEAGRMSDLTTCCRIWSVRVSIFVIIKVEREAGFAIGSRRLASRSQRYFFAHREDLHRIGSARESAGCWRSAPGAALQTAMDMILTSLSARCATRPFPTCAMNIIPAWS